MRGISKELGYIYITTSGDRYIKEEDAISQQAQINSVKESKKYIEERKQMEAKKILDVLAENGWGVYRKSHPIHQLSVQDSAPMFSVNAVNDDELLNAFTSNRKDDDTWHTETDSSQ